MNESLQKRLSSLENLIAIQRDCLEQGYMHGMLNGLICAHSVFTDDRPQFSPKVRGRKKKRTKIRHKSVITRKEIK